MFKVQLSDKYGTFSNAIVIGSKTGDTSGAIQCVIPKTISNGQKYRMKLISSNPVDTATDLGLDIKIYNPDSIATVSSNSPMCEKVNLVFTGSTSSTGVTWQWTGPNGFSSSVQSPSLPFGNPLNSGDYYVTATLNGCSYKDTLPVLVKPLPANLSLIGDTVCAGTTATLGATTISTGVSYAWSGPNSFSSTLQNNSLTNTTTSLSGTYILNATLNGCTATDSTKILVTPSPTAVTLSTTPICEGATLQLNSTASSTGASYLWTGVNSFTANTQNSTISNATTTATGWYKMTVDLNGCTIIDSIYATVYSLPQKPTINYNSPLCERQELVLVTNFVAGATYSWTGPNGFTSSAQTPTKAYTQFTDAGTYRATVTVNGCTSPEDTVNVSVKTSPFISTAFSPSDTICVGDMAQFNATPNNHGGSPTFQWYINNNPAGTSAAYSTNLLKDKDKVYCVMTEYTQCSASFKDTSSTIIMTVLPWETPTVAITSTSDTIKSGGFIAFGATNTFGGNAPQYQWKLNGTNIGGAISAVWSANTLADNDEVCVEMTSSYKCPSPATVQSNCINVIVRNPADVNDINNTATYTLYPNPNDGKFILKGKTNSTEPVLIKVINSIGAVVYQEMATPRLGILNTEINLDNIASGIYFVRMQSASSIDVISFTVR